MYIKVCGPNHTQSRHSETVFFFFFLSRRSEQGSKSGQHEDAGFQMWKWCERVSKDGDGAAGEQETWGQTKSLLPKCEVSFAPGPVVVASGHVFAMLAGWKEHELRNQPPPKSHASPFSRLSLLGVQLGWWGVVYYSITCTGVESGETLTRCHVGQQKIWSAVSNLLKPSNGNQIPPTNRPGERGWRPPSWLTKDWCHTKLHRHGFLFLCVRNLMLTEHPLSHTEEPAFMGFQKHN